MNAYLTPAMARTLETMRKHADTEDGELVKDAHGSHYWLGLAQVHPGTVKKLLQLVLVSGELGDRSGSLDRFHINEEGCAILDDDFYRPKVIDALRKQARV